MTSNTNYTFTEHLGNAPTKLYITVETRMPTELIFVGFDPNPEHPNTVYFNRRKEIRGKETLEFPIPLAPDYLKVNIYTRSSFPFVVHGQSISDLVLKPFALKTDEIESLEFKMNFAEQAGYLPLGNYYSPSKDFVIMYQDTIDGVTPARVHRLSGVTKVSRNDMIKSTIPMRVFILGHEDCHHFLPTKSEEVADSCSLKKYYLNLGFPQTEANYAMTKVFGDSSSRANLINHQIVEYENFKKKNAHYF